MGRKGTNTTPRMKQYSKNLEEFRVREELRLRILRLLAEFESKEVPEYGKPTKEDPKRNEYLVEWEQLPDGIKQIDRDMSGTIDANELAAVRNSKMHVGTADKMMELMSTHPNMLKRIQRLATLQNN